MFRRALLRLSRTGPFDPYKILGVAPTATPTEIKKAYHQLALRFHPDGGPEGNSSRFQAVHEAYEAVKDGKWTPPPPERDSDGRPTSSSSSSSGQYPKGWNEKHRMYVYEEPGSTSESYVEHDAGLRRNLQIMLVACFGFILIRGWWFYTTPRRPAPLEPSINGILNPDQPSPQQQQQQSTTTPGRAMVTPSSSSAVKSSGSVLGDDDWQTYRHGGQQQPGNGARDVAVYDFSSDTTAKRN